MTGFFIHLGITPTMSFTGSYRDTGHSLRQRAHNLTLPSDVGSTARQNFIMRMLFTDIYTSVFTFQMLLCMFCTSLVFFLFSVML